MVRTQRDERTRYQVKKYDLLSNQTTVHYLEACPTNAGNYIVAMLTKIVPIGNSRGIRIPKAMLEHCGFGEEVELQAKNGALILRPVNTPRAGWADAFGDMAAAKDDAMVHEDTPTATQFDAEEWQW